MLSSQENSERNWDLFSTLIKNLSKTSNHEFFEVQHSTILLTENKNPRFLRQHVTKGEN